MFTYTSIHTYIYIGSQPLRLCTLARRGFAAGDGELGPHAARVASAGWRLKCAGVCRVWECTYDSMLYPEFRAGVSTRNAVPWISIMPSWASAKLRLGLSKGGCQTTCWFQVSKLAKASRPTPTPVSTLTLMVSVQPRLICIYVCIYIYIYRYIHMYMYIFVCTCVCIHMYMYIRM